MDAAGLDAAGLDAAGLDAAISPAKSANDLRASKQEEVCFLR
ncbi:MAG: hypothetical protein VX438_17070 [Planctomycetota bacterium]|nr:hypothetical protein [Planctomycetota bacterium]